MRIVVTGSGGLIGSALAESLRAGGHEVVRLVRRVPAQVDEVQWDPVGGTVDMPGLAGVEAAVHLAGAGVGDHRWTDTYEREIRDSRVLGTRTLVRALSALDPLPRVLVSGSAIGAYGDRGDEILTEESALGDDFLADVVRDWEAEAGLAAEAGIRVAYARTGIVLSREGGALGRLMPLVRFGLGGPMGSGRQWWSWITLDDQIGALRFLLDHDVDGPVNLTAPEPARQAELVKALASSVGRPSVLPAPAIALRAVLGEFASTLVGGQRVLPARLLAAGFEFAHPNLPIAADWVTQRDEPAA